MGTLVQYFCMWIDHHKSIYHSLPYKVVTMLILVPMLYVTFQWLIYFIARGLYLKPVSPNFHLCSLLATTSVSVSMSLLLFCLFVCFVDSTCKWNHVVFVFDLISLSVIGLGPSMLSQVARFHSLHGQVIFPCRCAPHLCDPFISWRALRLFPYLGYCK